MKKPLLLVAVLSLTGTAIPQDQPSDRAAMIARAKALEIPTPYVPPPGDPLAHHASGFAKIMCSAAFIIGLDPDFAAANVGGFTSPFDTRAKLGKPKIDREGKAVHVTLPIGETAPRFKPIAVKRDRARAGRSICSRV